MYENERMWKECVEDEQDGAEEEEEKKLLAYKHIPAHIKDEGKYLNSIFCR